MPEQFMIGSENNIYDLLPLDDIFSPAGGAWDPDWSFQPFAASVELGSGLTQGHGFPVAIWRWNQLSNVNREALRELCPGLSAIVYINTKTNETSSGAETWGTFRAVMNWTPEDEDKQADRTLGVVIRFTMLEEQV